MFRCSFIPVFNYLSIAWLAGALIALVVAMFQYGLRLVTWILVTHSFRSVGRIYLLLIAVGWLYCWFEAVTVGEEGIAGRDRWGRRVTLPRQEICGASPTKCFGLRFVRLTGRGGRNVLRLPLFLADMPGFREFVARCSGPENVLSLYLDSERA